MQNNQAFQASTLSMNRKEFRGHEYSIALDLAFQLTLTLWLICVTFEGYALECFYLMFVKVKSKKKRRISMKTKLLS